MVLLVIRVVPELTVMLVTQELVPLPAVLVGQAIPVVMATLATLVQMATLVQTATREVQPLLWATQTT